MKTFLTLAILSSVAAAPAMAESFTRDGEAYRYKVTSNGGYQLITGTNISTGDSFRLRVKRGTVSGIYGKSKVLFQAEPLGVAATSGSGPLFAAK